MIKNWEEGRREKGIWCVKGQAEKVPVGVGRREGQARSAAVNSSLDSFIVLKIQVKAGIFF